MSTKLALPVLCVWGIIASSSDAQRISDGLVVGYDFREGAGLVVGDYSGNGTPLDLKIHHPERVTWGEGFLTFDRATIVSTANAPYVQPQGTATKIFDAITATEEITMEAWIQADNDVDNDGPARIMNMGIDHVTRNFFLGQRTVDFEARLRTTSTDDNGNNIKLLTSEGTVSLEIQHVVYTRNVAGDAFLYVDGEEALLEGNIGDTLIDGNLSNWDDSFDFMLGNEATFDQSPPEDRRDWLGDMYLIAIYDRALSANEVGANFAAGHLASIGEQVGVRLQAGDADQNLVFDQLDLVKVQIAAKYLTGQAATWGEGDWDGAPGGSRGNPPAGDGFFNQLDIVAAVAPGHYLTGPVAAIGQGGISGDDQTSLVYDPRSGELSIDAPAGMELTSINITAVGEKFIGAKPAALDGTFDNYAADNVFKATFGGSFSSLSFGNVLPAGISQVDVAADLSAVGSLAGGGDLGNVDLIYLPEPTAVALLVVGLAGVASLRWLRHASAKSDPYLGAS